MRLQTSLLSAADVDWAWEEALPTRLGVGTSSDDREWWDFYEQWDASIPAFIRALEKRMEDRLKQVDVTRGDYDDYEVRP